MLKILALGSALLCVSSMDIAVAQQRLEKSSGESVFGVGTGVGDVSKKKREPVQVFERKSFLDSLPQVETEPGPKSEKRVRCNQFKKDGCIWGPNVPIPPIKPSNLGTSSSGQIQKGK